MTWGNKFYEFDEPIRWFKAVGLSPSNTYVGASRGIDTVYEQAVIGAGDVVHALTGGTFLVRKDGSVEAGRFKLPKHLFEKTYGIPETDADLLGRMAARGLCHEVAAPAGRVDYGSVRHVVNARRFPECTGSVTRENYVASPLFASLMAQADSSGLREAVASAGGKLHVVDVGLGGNPDSLDCLVQVRVPDGGSLDLGASQVHERISVSQSEGGGFLEALQADGGGSAGLSPNHYSPKMAAFPASEVEDVMRALATYVEHGRVSEPTGPTR